jgi:tetratricopeptide (TPR) repeat protein
MADAESFTDLIARADAHYAAARYDDALTLYQQAADAASGREKALGEAKAGDARRALAQFDAAEAAYRQALTLLGAPAAPRPDILTASIYNCLGLTEAAQGKPADAIATYQLAQTYYPPDSPDRALPLNNWGDLLFAEGAYPAAAENYDAAVKIKPDYFDAIHSCGRALFELRQLEKALQRFDAAAEGWGGSPDTAVNRAVALNNAGLTLKRLWRLDEAAARFVAAVDAMPADAPRFEDLAAAADLLTMRESDGAVDVCQLAESRAAQTAAPLQARIDNLARWGDALRNLEDFVAAETVYLRALDQAAAPPAPPTPAPADPVPTPAAGEAAP